MPFAVFASLTALVFAPLVVAAFEECWSGAARRFPTSDLAVLEVGVRHAGQQLVGPYSQFEFRHPGPLLFWVLWPAYRLGGQSTVALHIGALFINAAALGGVLLACFRLSRTRLGRAANLAAITVFVHYLGGFISSAVDSSRPSAFVDIWNPIVTILPFAAFCAACALLISGRPRAAVFVVALHAFVCQSHVGFAPVATAMLVFSIVAALRSSVEGRRTWVMLPVVVFGLCWAPTLLDAFFGSRNASALAQFFLSTRPRPAPGVALIHAAQQLEAPLTYAVGRLDPAEPMNGTLLPLILLAVEVAGLVACAVRRKARSPLNLLSVLTLVAIAFAIFSANQVDATLRLYPTAWFGVVGMLGWMAAFGGIGVAADGSSGRGAWLRRRLSRPAEALCALVVLGISVGESFRIHHAYRAFRADVSDDSRAVPVLARAFQRSARLAPRPILLTVEDREDWELLAGVVLALERRGVPFRLDDEWRFMFGAGPHYGRPDADSLRVSTVPVADRVALATRGREGLYAQTGAGRRVGAPSTALWVLEDHGTEHDTTHIVSGEPVPEGAPWDDPGAVIFADTHAWVLLGSAGALVEGVDVLADANDDYAVDASTDGATFREIARARATEGTGLRWRHVSLAEPTAPPLLRIRPVSGDGSYSVGAVALKAKQWGVAILDRARAGGHPDAAADGRIPRADAATSSDDAALLPAAGSSLTALLPVYPMETVDFVLRGPARYEVEGAVDCVAFSDAQPLDCEAPITTQVVQLTDHEAWRCLRVSPLPPFGNHAVVEIIPHPVRNAVVLDLGTPSARVHLTEGWSGDEYDGWDSWVWAVGRHAAVEVTLAPATAYQLSFDAAPHVAKGRLQRLTARLNGVLLGSIELSAGANAVTFEVPRGVATSASRLEFDFSDACSPLELGESEDPRPLAVRFDRIAFIRR